MDKKKEKKATTIFKTKTSNLYCPSQYQKKNCLCDWAVSNELSDMEKVSKL